MSRTLPKPHISLRLPAVAAQQIADLAAWWGENRTQVILRAIALAWTWENARRERAGAGEEAEEDEGDSEATGVDRPS